MTKTTEPPLDKPPEDSLAKLAEFTKRILQVRRDELPDKNVSHGPTPDIDRARNDDSIVGSKE